MKIILASNSPRRKELLHTVFEDFDIISSDFNEKEINEKEPEKLVKLLSFTKSKKVFDKIQDKYSKLIVIGGDTLVYFCDEILGKPKDEEDAYNTLKKLQGNKNEVYSAFTIIVKMDKKITEETYVTKSIVTMKNIEDSKIKEYIKTKEPMDKAGSYAVQGKGSMFIDKIEGSYDAIVGLDIEKLKQAIEKYKI